MKQRIIVGVLCLALMVSFVGCRSSESTDDEMDGFTVENDTGEAESEVAESEDTEVLSPEEVLAERDGVLAGYAIITPYIQVILTNNGKVLSRGENMYGQLGNGERTNSADWVEVEGLEDVVGIYRLGNIGEDTYDKHAYGRCYALTDSGELYRWGGNILTPEKVTLFSKIKEVKSLNSENLFIKCDSGEKYIIIPRFNKNCDDSVYSYNSLPDDAELSIACSNDEYLVYSEGELTVVKADGLHQRGTDSISQIRQLEDEIHETVTIDNTDPIENMIPCIGRYGTTLISEKDGHMIGLGYDENGSLVAEDLGGKFIKKASMNYNYTCFVLYTTGELLAIGDNGEGQLGDGTMTDYYDGFISIDEASFLDFEYNSTKVRYCVALDTSYNVWGWGEGFGATPDIVVLNTDFILE